MMMSPTPHDVYLTPTGRFLLAVGLDVLLQAVLSLPGILDHPELAKIVGFDRCGLV
eukprot:COSAG06_NODE_4535_length_4168_cov_3.593512_3_plen_56_part_00